MKVLKNLKFNSIVKFVFMWDCKLSQLTELVLEQKLSALSEHHWLYIYPKNKKTPVVVGFVLKCSTSKEVGTGLLVIHILNK